MKATLNDFRKSKETECLFRQDEFDSKKKLNRSDKKIPLEMLENIEKGITSEQLDKFKVPVFKYGTQITIHGIFPNIEHSIIVGGYKRIFQNKNKSIGVKYEAIDYEKKKRIYRAFSHLYGFTVSHDSREYCVYKMIQVKDKEDAMLKKEENQPLLDRITIRFGSKQMYFARINFYGQIRHYLVIVVHINAIYESEMATFFLETFGKTEMQINDEIRLAEEEKNCERAMQHLEWEKQQAIRKEKEAALLNAELERLAGLGYEVKRGVPVTDGLAAFNVTVETDYTTKEQHLQYKLFHFYKPVRARKFSYSTKCYKTLDEVIMNSKSAHKSYNDRKAPKETINAIIL